MLLNFIKVAFRNIWRHKVYSLINIIGLSIGMVCCLFVYIFVSHELSYDKFHPNSKRIFRVIEESQKKSECKKISETPFHLADVLKKDFVEVEYSGYLLRNSSMFVKSKKMDMSFYEKNIWVANQGILNIFSVPFLKGNSVTALLAKNSAVITESIALKYFGMDNPLGEILKINGSDFKITGVVKNPPTNTHWKYNIIIRFNENDISDSWLITSNVTYVKLRPNVDPNRFSEKIRYLSHKYIGDLLKTRETVVRFFLQPVETIHLHSNIVAEIEPPGNFSQLIIFSTVGLLVLLIASINFLNLSISSAAFRVREIAILRTFGSSLFLSFLEFLCESFIIVFMSSFVTLAICESLFPIFSFLTRIEFNTYILYQPNNLLFMLALILFTGIISGLYPAFIAFRFNPISVLKSVQPIITRKNIVRKTLILLQFSISIILIILFFHISDQLKFMKTRNLGIDKNQKLIIQFPENSNLKENYGDIKTKFLENSNILNASFSSYVIGNDDALFYTIYERGFINKSILINFVSIDPDFISNYKLKILAGRTFDKKIPTDETTTCIINEEAVKALGWGSPKNAIGKFILPLSYFLGKNQIQVIGVVENFHFNSLKNSIAPIFMMWHPKYFKYFTLTIGKNSDLALSSLRQAWNRFFPGYPFKYFYLDKNFDNLQYNSEEREYILFKVFSILGELIACLGLLGLAGFLAQRRTKEIGIRKALGESTLSIMLLISKEFLLLVALSNLIAWPLAYIAVTTWLSNFAYHIDISVWPFIISGALVFTLAALTVCFQTIKAASANPVKSLRYE